MSAAETTASAATQRRTEVTSLTLAAWATVGAGAIHAAAVGVHADERQAAMVFAAVAVFQLTWGAVAVAVQNRIVALVGAGGSTALLGGWIMAQTTGIGFVNGLEGSATAQAPDSLAALLAGVTALLCLAALTTPRAHLFWRPVGRLTSVIGVVAVVGLTVPGLVGAADHVHDHDDGGRVHEDAHDHPDEPEEVTGTHAGHEDGAGVAPPKPYDPDLPIDLGGVEGVTPQQQAAAENLIAVTLLRLPQFADPAAAEAAGFHSIGDGFTGHEHYVNYGYIDDGRLLDPDYPESLVYEVRGEQKTLVAAMYMLQNGDTLDDVPELGGDLTQWHIHDDLCFTDDPVAPLVRGLTNPAGECDPPLVKGAQVPMIHVWIVPHECGPFAALEGVAGGTIAEGEERLCDHAHGA